MSAASRSPELLDRIAATLGVPVDTFTAPQALLQTGDGPGAQIAALLFDPDGRRLAAAFVDLPPHTRKALADIAEVCRGCRAVEPDAAEGRT